MIIVQRHWLYFTLRETALGKQLHDADGFVAYRKNTFVDAAAANKWLEVCDIRGSVRAKQEGKL